MSSVHYLIMKVNAILSKQIMAEAGTLGLTPGQPKILECLWNLEEADQKTIASYCEIEPATVGSILLRMEEAGLVLRRQRQGNRRSLFVSLTDKGKDIASQLLQILDGIECSIEETLTPEGMKELKDFLIKLEDKKKNE